MTAALEADAMHTIRTAEHKVTPAHAHSLGALGEVYSLIHSAEQARLRYETTIGFETIVEGMAAFVPEKYVNSSIDTYRVVIRRNNWYYPIVTGKLTDVATFFHLWDRVHAHYFKLACSIFEQIQQRGLGSLADAALYQAVIESETSRGWVGKRSAIGPDRQTEERVDRVERLLVPFMSLDEVDQVLDIGGALPGTRLLRSAEEDLTANLAELLELRSRGQDFSAVRQVLLRDYCKYSEADLENKLSAYSPRPPADLLKADSREALERTLDGLDLAIRTEVTNLLTEIQTLNFLNLNLEPRHSFKGWAGLMHGLVFATVRDLPGMSDDIYLNLKMLKEIK